ncbi:MAG: hypothetical protein R3301_06860 [Saprospiraceae bacterium]|nr:hypothetical protein [Saprospiraceae bacterium]
MNIRTRTLTLLALLLGSLPALAQADWSLSKQQRGVSIYTRDHPDFPVKEYRAEVTVGVPLSQVIAFFEQTARHAEWMAGVADVQRPPKAPETLLYILEMPFPFRNRCMWLRQTVESVEGRHTVSLHDTAGFPPEGTVLIPRVQGFWQFERISSAQTRIIQQFVTDPGEAMPDWLVNLFIVKHPYKTMRQVRAALEGQAVR